VHDRYFISGCFDGKIRFWDVIANSTLDFILTRSGGEEDAGKVTCVKFTPDGGKIVAGFFGGKVAVYYCIARGDMKYELKYQTEFFCKDRAGRYLNGRKVTGLSFIEGTKATFEAGIPLASARKDAGKGSVVLENYLLLVTTNDSNVRLVDWAEKTTFVKYKGGLNESLQTQASLSDCDRFIISGTDDGSTVIWETQHFDNPLCIHTFEPPRPHKRNATMAKFQSSLKDKKTGLAPPVTSASFAPISAVHNVLESAEELYRLAIGSRDRDGPRSRIDSFGSDTERGSLPSLGGESTPGGDSGKNHHHHDFVPVDAPSDVPLYRAGDEDAFGSLIMATADLDGNLRIYVRESSEV
jgi:WD40 repeat protein